MSPIRCYRHRVQVRDADIDQNGHVNNVVYVQWLQDAAVAHATAVGCAQATAADGAAWVVRSHHVEYLRPALRGDAVTVWTWIANLKRVRSLRRYRVVRDADGAVLARGETDWVYVDAGSGHPRAIPPQVFTGFVLVPDGEDPLADAQ